MWTLLSGLILAAVSALAYIAYRHPHGFANIHGPLQLLNTVAFLLIAAWAMGAGSMRTLALPYVDETKYVNFLNASDSAIPQLLPVAGVIFAITVYLAILSVLPQILGPPTSGKKSNGD